MQVQYWFELFGIAFFAISGVLVAMNRSDNDWFGVSFMGFITAIGGGSLRDVLLGSYPIAWIKDVNMMYSILIGIVVARLTYPALVQMRKTFFLFDTLGIALFTVVGTSKAIAMGVGSINAAMMGMFTAVFGGVIRDTLTNEIPIIFRKEIYATACFAGALLFVWLHKLDVSFNINLIISGTVIASIRFLSVKYNWNLPQFKGKEK